MVDYEKSEMMKDRAIKRYTDGKLDDHEFIVAVKKAGYGDSKAAQVLERAKKSREAFLKNKAYEKAEIAGRTAAAAQMKKDNDGVPTVDQVEMKPLSGKPVIGAKGPKKPATHDKKDILTVGDIEKDYNPDKAILGKTGPAKGVSARKVAEPVSETKKKHDAAREKMFAEISKNAITKKEQEAFLDGKLSKEELKRLRLSEDYNEALSLKDTIDSLLKESVEDKEIQKIDKAIAKATKAAESKKVQSNPEAKKGAKRLIKELESKKAEALKLKAEKETAEREAREAKSEEAKKRAELRALKADRVYKKFVKAKDPLMMVCKVLTTATGIAAVIALFMFVGNNTESGKLLSKLNYYLDSGGQNDNPHAERINDALSNAGRAFGRGSRSVVTEDYFPY